MTNFICEVDEQYRSACKGLDLYRDHEGKQYCVLHFPGEKKEDFEQIRKSKRDRKDYDFGGAIFPEDTSRFEGYEFDGDVNFLSATFSGVTAFSGAQFSGDTTFEWALFSGGADLSEAQFSGKTDFSGALFNEESYFREAHFGGDTTFEFAEFSGETNFSGVQFSGAEHSFREATFKNVVDFSAATFKEVVDFWGRKENWVFASKAGAWFDSVRIEKPEKLSFNTVLLHPGWFIDTDVRKVDFTDVKWYGMPGGPRGTLEEEIAFLTTRKSESPHTQLAQACRRLSANAEENREYPLANEFHYWSLDALRKERWYSLGLIGTLYWALSGYGVRAARAFLVLVGICAAFAALYMVFGPPKLQDLGQAVVYSLGAVARLNPEPRPTEPGLFQFLVIVEGLLGPLQIALLALAVRRKVMR